MKFFEKIHLFVSLNIKMLEMTGVLMRICSFSLVSWQGPNSPFAFVWFFNTVDALLLTWCSAVRKDAAYILLNTFWIFVGIVGMTRAMGNA